MPQIRPLSDLREHTHEISQIWHDSGEPVHLTEEGKEDLVMMSLKVFERLQARLELYRLLDEAEEDVRQGDEGIGVAAMRKRLMTA